MFDTLKAARRLQDEAGFDEKQAAVLVSTFAEGVTENLATKTDLAQGLTVLRGEGRALLSRGGTTYLDTRPIRASNESMVSELIADMRAFEQRLCLFMGLVLGTAAAFLTAVISIATAILLANL